MHNRVLERNIHRDGSPIADYVPAIELLVGRGFQVLLAGDQTLERDHMDSFGGMVVDAAKLGVDLDMFRLFAPLESDICVGDAGSGMIFPMIMNLPTLTMNFHPFGYALPGTWVYPKRVHDESGDPVPFRKVLQEDPFGYYTTGGSRHKNWVPEKNTSEDILEAMQCFLEWFDGKAAPERDTGLEGDIPKLSMYHSFGARISPAFLKRHHLTDSQESNGQGEALSATAVPS
jgi:putative glycosyltransferase (TIGR04372 family)